MVTLLDVIETAPMEDQDGDRRRCHHGQGRQQQPATSPLLASTSIPARPTSSRSPVQPSGDYQAPRAGVKVDPVCRRPYRQCQQVPVPTWICPPSRLRRWSRNLTTKQGVDARPTKARPVPGACHQWRRTTRRKGGQKSAGRAGEAVARRGREKPGFAQRPAASTRPPGAGASADRARPATRDAHCTPRRKGPLSGDSQRLDQAVGGDCGGNQTCCEGLHGLMMSCC